MPFTPSHAVVALPFIRSPLLPSAVAVGAMTPDLPLFLRGTPLTYSLTHTHVFLATMLAGGLLVLWYVLLRPAVRELAPPWLARRLPPEWDATGAAVWRVVRAPRGQQRVAGRRGAAVFVALVVVSLALGVVSHIVWDAFTHEGRWGVELLPMLNDRWGALPGFKWVQHGSSVVGLGILGVGALAWLRRRTPEPTRQLLPDAARWAWWLSLPLILATAWALGIAGYGPFTASWTPQHLAYRVLPPACAIWAGVTVALCATVVAIRARSARGGGGHRAA